MHVPGLPGFQASERDPSLAQALVRDGGPGVLEGMRQVPAPPGSHLDRYSWRIPAFSLAQDRHLYSDYFDIYIYIFVFFEILKEKYMYICLVTRN